MKFKIGDTVKITAGKDRGKISQILSVYPDKDRVKVKNVGEFKRHVKSRDGIEGGIVTLERPIPTASIALVCPACKATTRVGYTTPKSGDKHRTCKKCGSNLDTKPEVKKSKKK